MKLALSLGYAGAKMNIPLARVRRAEELGFEAVFCAETYSSDAITPLAYMGALTKRIKLGTSIAILSARTPANLAMWAKRGDGKKLKDFTIMAPMDCKVTNDVKGAIESLKPEIALYVGGMGAKDKNFHVEKMIRRGFPEAAHRIQELFLAGRKEEAAKAVPDEFIDEGALIGPPERLKQRYREFADSGLSMLSMIRHTDEVIETMGKIAAAA